MQTATVDASEVRFPPVCIRCGRSADATHDVTVTRSIDLIFVAYFKFVDVPVPVCRPCKRHRRVVGVLCWTGLPLVILVGGFLAFLLSDNGQTAGAIGAGLAIIALALLGRFWLDEIVEWKTLGVHLAWRKGPGIPLRVRFRRAEYFSAWAAVNPGVRLGSEAPHSRGKQPAEHRQEPASPRRNEGPTMSTAQTYDRRIPLYTLLGLTACLALHHWYAVTQHEVYFFALFILPMVWMLALGGVFHPPILYSIGKYGRDLPMATKITGGLFALSGLGLGFCLAKFVYGMF